MKNRFKEFIEKLKQYADEKNDDNLKEIVSAYDTQEDEEDDGGGGGNHPTEPPSKP